MEKYKQLVAELYLEPKDEEVLGSYLERENQGDIEKAPPTQNKEKERKESGVKDRTFFSPVQREPRKKVEKIPATISID